MSPAAARLFPQARYFQGRYFQGLPPPVHLMRQVCGGFGGFPVGLTVGVTVGVGLPWSSRWRVAGRAWPDVGVAVGVAWVGVAVGVAGVEGVAVPAVQAALALSHTDTSVVSVTPGGRTLEQPPALAYGCEPVHTKVTFW